MKIKFPPSFYGKKIYPWWSFAPHIQVVEDIVLDLFNDDNKNHLILSLPIRHGKTFYIQTLLPIALLAANPDERIIIASHSSSFSSESVARVRDLVCAYGHEIRPNFEVDPSWSSKDYFRLKNHLGEVRGVGTGSAFPGASATTILADDLYASQQEANSPTIRRNTEIWWHGTLMARKTPNDNHPPKVILVGTPRHPQCMELSLEAANPDLPQEEKWHVHRLPAITNGIPLWDHFPIEKLNNIKHQYESLGQGHLFETLYMCDPKLNPEGGWPSEYLKDLFVPYQPGHHTVKIMACDPNVGSQSDRSDYGCILYAIYDTDSGHICIEDCYLSRGSYDRLEDAAVNMLMKYKPRGLLIETNNAFKVIADNIDRKARQAGYVHPPIYHKVSTENKEDRIDTLLSPLLSQHKIHFKDMASTRLGLMQMKSFPEGDHDDFPDCIYLLTQLIAELQRNNFN